VSNGEKAQGGVTADHPPRPAHVLMVGPALTDELNTLQARIFPLACWRIEDIRFEFDSSFPLPDLADEMGELKKLIDKHTAKDPKTDLPRRPSISIFGHADPTGDDDYNKRLSGRRAMSIYGMLTRDAELWEELYTDKSGNDDWGTREIQTMLGRLGHSPGSTESIREFQGTHGLKPDGKAGPKTREALFLAYMQSVCIDAEGVPYSVEKSDFLAQGLDADGKGDYQGCGEFNPVLMFSKEENEKFKKDKTKRNQENAPNRRVMAFLFRPGIHVNPELWPCPRARQGVTQCKKRFWSDAKERRTFQDSRREFKDTEDTFACRFYQRLAANSPCDKPGLLATASLTIRVLDSNGAPLKGTDYTLQVGGQKFTGVTNGLGIFTHQVPKQSAKGQLEVPLGIFELDVRDLLQPPTAEDGAKARLQNLGLFSGDQTSSDEQQDPFRLAVMKFQSLNDLERTGELDPTTTQKLGDVHDG